MIAVLQSWIIWVCFLCKVWPCLLLWQVDISSRFEIDGGVVIYDLDLSSLILVYCKIVFCIVFLRLETSVAGALLSTVLVLLLLHYHR